MIAVHGVMKKIPISSGARPQLGATSLRRSSFAASSRGVSIGTRLAIRSG